MSLFMSWKPKEKSNYNTKCNKPKINNNKRILKITKLKKKTKSHIKAGPKE